MCESGVHAAANVLRHPIATQRNAGHRTAIRGLSKRLHEFQALAVRKPYIAQENIKSSARHTRPGFGKGGSHLHFMTPPLQESL